MAQGSKEEEELSQTNSPSHDATPTVAHWCVECAMSNAQQLLCIDVELQSCSLSPEKCVVGVAPSAVDREPGLDGRALGARRSQNAR